MTLLKIARDKAYSRLIKQEIGKNTHRTCEINRRHKSAEQLYSGKKCHIYTIEENTECTVESQSQPNTTYTVKRQVESCECHVRCKPCGVCTHTFTCTCLDSILHSTICKHIHLVIVGGDADKVHNEGFIENHPHGLLSQVKHPQATCDHNLRTLRNRVHSLTSEILLHIKDCSDANALQVYTKTTFIF